MQSKTIQRCVIVIILCVQLFSTAQAVSAQQTSTITATGTIGIRDGLPLTITFTPAGGTVTGSVFLEEDIGVDYPCVITWKINLTGTFTGGDGGTISGTSTTEMIGDCAWTEKPMTGTWSGNFYADGTGSGTVQVFGSTEFIGGGEVQQGPLDMEVPWQVTFSAEEFAAGLPLSATEEVTAESAPSTITTEYIYNTYGITIEDSFGDDQWQRTTWTDQELTLLNDVLKELPPTMINELSLTRIVRNKTNLDGSGNPTPNTAGVYQPCPDQKADPGCSNGSSATIRIFDRAHAPFDLANDPNGDKNFKATILHELTHAMQYKKDDSSIYKNAYSSPLMQNYMDATRPVTDMNQPSYWVNNGWQWQPQGSWRLTSAPGNQVPTNYAGKNPKEDMAESVRLYVYDPQKLKNSSPQRYNFVRDFMFEGIEYENGIRK